MSHLTRTFRPRRRGLSPARQEAFDAAIAAAGMAESGSVIDPVQVFGRTAPLVIEIGSGDGRATVRMAREQPEVDRIAIDVHTPGIAHILEAVEVEGLSNLKVVHGDAFEFLTRCADGTCAAVQAWFPDPWPKRRQQHRRLFAEGRLEQILRVIRPGGWLQVATDVTDYAHWLEQLCGTDPGLQGGTVPRDPRRPITKFEAAALEAGRRIHELAYQCIPATDPSWTN